MKNRFTNLIVTSALSLVVGCSGYSKDYPQIEVDLDGNNIPESNLHIREYVEQGDLRYTLVLNSNPNKVLFDFGSEKPRALRFEDVNQDGLLDVVYECGFSFNSTGRKVAFNQGNFTFGSSSTF